MSSVEENNKALVRRFIEEFYNRGNMDVADELLAPNFVAREALTREETSIEDYKREIAEQAATSSDLHFTIEEQIAEGEKVVTRYIGSGTHDLAEYEGLAPTGVRITIENNDNPPRGRGQDRGRAEHERYIALVEAAYGAREDRT